jgi:hypothetical protein
MSEEQGVLLLEQTSRMIRSILLTSKGESSLLTFNWIVS